MSHHMWIFERKSPMTDQKWIPLVKCLSFDEALICVPSDCSFVLKLDGYRYYTNIRAMMVFEEQEVYAYRIKKLY